MPRLQEDESGRLQRGQMGHKIRSMHIPWSKCRLTGAQGLLDIRVTRAATATAEAHLDQFIQGIKVICLGIFQDFCESTPMANAMRNRLERILINHQQNACST